MTSYSCSVATSSTCTVAAEFSRIAGMDHELRLASQSVPFARYHRPGESQYII